MMIWEVVRHASRISDAPACSSCVPASTAPHWSASEADKVVGQRTLGGSEAPVCSARAATEPAAEMGPSLRNCLLSNHWNMAFRG